MNLEDCRVCNSPLGTAVFSGLLLGTEIDYFDCKVCGYVQTQEPTWLDQACSAAINSCDTGIMLRNQANVAKVLATLTALDNRLGRVVDCAGGYGILVRLLRDRGVDAFWADPYCQNLLAIGFEHRGEQACLVTAFEAFEHFAYPIQELEKLFSIAPNILFSTEIIPSPAPQPDKWWYYGGNHGQHIGFFRVRTLQYLAKRFGKCLATDGHSYHLLSHAPISRLHWRLNLLIAKRWPSLFTRGMKTKVWSDFEELSKHQ